MELGVKGRPLRPHDSVEWRPATKLVMLMEAPLATVERIYSELSIPGWQKAKPWIAARVQQAKHYRARPVQLAPEAEQRLQLMFWPPEDETERNSSSSGIPLHVRLPRLIQPAQPHLGHLRIRSILGSFPQGFCIL